MALDEFGLVETFLKRPTQRTDVTLGIGDDCALVEPPAGYELALTIDTLVAGVHFPNDLDADDIGYRALAVNLSDLAAMGAAPAFATLSLCLPQPDESWLRKFAAGFFELADEHDLALVGGDTVRGTQLTITVQLTGYVPVGQALRRSGAQPGDAIVVSGPLGLAALALQARAAGVKPPAIAEQKLRRPSPRVTLGRRLCGIVNACIDVSDGLCADLGHILTASDCGAVLEEAQLPTLDLAEDVTDCTNSTQAALTGGDDYELCFTVAPERLTDVRALADESGAKVYVIGVIQNEPGLLIKRRDGTLDVLSRDGYRHF